MGLDHPGNFFKFSSNVHLDSKMDMQINCIWTGGIQQGESCKFLALAHQYVSIITIVTHNYFIYSAVQYLGPTYHFKLN